MVKPLRDPCRSDVITFPVFSLAWHGNSTFNPNVDSRKSYNPVNCNVLAYCGGGGSAATGVGNTFQIRITYPSGFPRDITLDTGKQIGVSIALYQCCDGGDHHIKFLVAVGDEVWLYSLSLVDEEADVKKVGTILVGKGFGCNAVAFHPSGERFAVGCENGQVVMYRILCDIDTGNLEFKTQAILSGHIKAVCSISYHPRGLAVLSSAKDGTCRIWDGNATMDKDRNFCMHTLECLNMTMEEAQKSQKPKPKPGQILVRGCAFGDLEGKIVYSVQSGRRGKAFLSRWHLTVIPPAAENERPKYHFTEVCRIPCSPCPVSAMDLSGDARTLALGGVDGSILLYNTEKMSLMKKWDEVHDLPITCIASRPMPTDLPGDIDDIRIDAITASADNKLSFVTTERRRRKKRTNTSTTSTNHGLIYWIWLLIMISFIGFLCKESYEICETQIITFDVPEAVDCILNSALWAPPSTPGIMFVPH